MQNQKKPIQQKKPMQNFTAEKWADKIALFIDNFGFLSGFFWHWTIALPSPTSHLAMLHSKIILSDPNRRVKVVLIGFSLFWSRCRTWGMLSVWAAVERLPSHTLSLSLQISHGDYQSRYRITVWCDCALLPIRWFSINPFYFCSDILAPHAQESQVKEDATCN